MNIIYKPIRKSDLKIIVKWLNDPGTNQYLGASVRRGTNSETRLNWYKKYKNEKTKKIFIISSDKKPIGQVGLTDINLQDNNAELYVVIGEKEFRGKGIGQQAIKYIIDYAFNNLKLHRISLGCFEENIAGMKCYEKRGFKKEGVVRDQFYKNGKYYNEVKMGLINDK